MRMQYHFTLYIVESRHCPVPDPEPPGLSVLLHKVLEKLVSLQWWFTILTTTLSTEEGDSMLIVALTVVLTLKWTRVHPGH